MKRFGRENNEDKLDCTFWTRADGQLCAQYFRSAADNFYQPHIHSEYVIMICLAGEVAQTQFAATDVAGPGEAVISNFGVEHVGSYRPQNAPRCEMVGLTFDRRLLAALQLQLPATAEKTCLAFTGRFGNEMLHRCALEIANEFRHRAGGHKIIIESLATRLLVETIRAWPRLQIEIIPADETPRLPRRDFIRAYEFMRRCRKETFRLQHLCHFLGSSEERFTRLFLATTKSTPANFYNRMLLQRGRDLLQDSNLSVKEISFELGFKTTSHFIVAFRREFSAAPQEYRQRLLARPLPSNGPDSLAPISLAH